MIDRSGCYHFDVPLRERNTLRPTEDLQQHRDALMRSHTGIDRQMPPERTGRNPQAVASLECAPGELDRPVMFPILNFRDHLIWYPCWLYPFITSRTTPGHQRAACHCSAIRTKA